ncbi:DoxX family protein [Flavobacterium sp.]|uniref:DoxX family protein n=1 Tax=Flavobacterium sp. TaxID=239 RepID=UPI002FDE6792
MKNQFFIWIVKLTAVVILLQTLFFKFSGASESVYIFQTLGIEPYGRIGSGVVELIASILILIPRTTLLGALLGLGTMLGAVFSHIFVLGIEIQNDGGTLFVLAAITLLCCLILVFREREKLFGLLQLKF